MAGTAQSTTYSFLDNSTNILGPGGIADFTSGADKGGITITPAMDANMQHIGADGSGMNVLIAGQPGTISVKLLKNSVTNNRLSVMYNLQKTSSALWGINTINIKSGVGDVTVCTGVAFKRRPTVVHDQDGEMNVWEFDCINYQQLLASAIL